MKTRQAVTLHSQRGQMLLLALLVGVVICVVIFIGITFIFPFFVQKRAQTEADTCALELSNNLNAQDRAGQFNNLVVLCRNLVFASRQTHNATLKGYNHLTPLAQQLLEESRASAVKLEQERQRLIGVTVSDLRNNVNRLQGIEKIKQTMILPSMSATPPTLAYAELGSIKDVQSNVQTAMGIPELVSADKQAGYIQPGSLLYLGNVNAKLPGEDSDLNFKISSLAAPVSGEITRARLTLPKVFQKSTIFFKDGKVSGSAPDQIPSAIKVVYLHGVKTALNKSSPAELAAQAIAACNGGGKAP